MKRTALPKRLQELLRQVPYVTIATVCPDGRPWNSPVVGRFDADLNLYWVSWRENQHSQNIAYDPRIFVVVYDSHAPEGTGEGLYLRMRARAIDTPRDLKAASKVYDTSFFAHDFPHDQFLSDCPQRIYRAVPQRVWCNADGEAAGHFVDVRHELLGS